MEGTDTEGLRDKARAEGGSSVKGHKESQSPHVVRLIVLLGSLPKQVVLEKETSVTSGFLTPFQTLLPEMRGWTLDTNVRFPRIHNFQFPLVLRSVHNFSPFSLGILLQSLLLRKDSPGSGGTRL